MIQRSDIIAYVFQNAPNGTPPDDWDGQIRGLIWFDNAPEIEDIDPTIALMEKWIQDNENPDYSFRTELENYLTQTMDEAEREPFLEALQEFNSHLYPFKSANRYPNCPHCDTSINVSLRDYASGAWIGFECDGCFTVVQELYNPDLN